MTSRVSTYTYAATSFFTQLFISPQRNVFLQFRITIPFALKRDRFQLLVFTCPPQERTQISLVCLDAVPEEKQTYIGSVHIPSKVFSSKAAFIHYWLYCESSDNDTQKLRSEWRFAFASQRINQWRPDGTDTFDMKDIEQVKQANVKVTQGVDESLDDIRSLCQNNNTSMIRPLLGLLPNTKLIDIVTDHYRHISYDEESQSFVTFDSPIGTLPILSYAVLANQLQNPRFDDRSRFLRHLIRITCAQLGFNYQRLYLLDANSILLLLVEAIGLPCRSLLYVSDFSRSGENSDNTQRIKSIDDWVRLDMCPDLSTAAFDCEDGSAYNLSLLCVIKSHSFPLDREYDGVRVVQRALRGYTCCLVLCQIWCGPKDSDYSPHCTVMAIDSSFLDDNIQGRSDESHLYRPTLLFESTNHTDGIWREEEWKSPIGKSKARTYNEEQRIQEGRHSSWRRIFKSRVPGMIADEQTIFGDVSSVITSDHNGRAIHLMAEENGTLGISFHRFMLNKPVHLYKVLELNVEEISTLVDALSECPKVRFPSFGDWQNKEEDVIIAEIEENQKKIVPLSSFMKWTCRPQDTNPSFQQALIDVYGNSSARSIVQQTFALCPDFSLSEISARCAIQLK